MLKGNAQSETICSENGPVTEKLQVLPDFMQVRMSSLNTHKMKNKIVRAIYSVKKQELREVEVKKSN